MSNPVAYLLTAALSFTFGVIAYDIAEQFREQGRICVEVDVGRAADRNAP